MRCRYRLKRTGKKIERKKHQKCQMKHKCHWKSGAWKKGG